MTPNMEDIPNYCRDHIEEVNRVSNRLSAIEAVQGKITLSPSLWAFLLAFLLAVMGTAGASAVSAYQAKEAVAEVKALANKVEEHMRQPWTPAAGYRMDRMDGQIKDIEGRKK